MGNDKIDNNGLNRDTLKQALKVMIVEECDKEISPDDIDDREQLIGGPLELDSLDALQICMEVKNRYGVRIESGPAARRALESVAALADTIIAERGV